MKYMFAFAVITASLSAVTASAQEVSQGLPSAETPTQPSTLSAPLGDLLRNAAAP